MSRPALHLALVAVTVSALVGCGGRTRNVAATTPSTQPVPVRSDVDVGICADPERQGVFGPDPQLERADRDLDGDGVAEMIVVDRALCTAERNCHWNIYRTERASAGERTCHRYIGTVSAAVMQRLATRGEQGFHGLRGWWRLTGGERVLLQEYHFQRGGYRLREALLCRHDDGDQLLCEESGR